VDTSVVSCPCESGEEWYGLMQEAVALDVAFDIGYVTENFSCLSPVCTTVDEDVLSSWRRDCAGRCILYDGIETKKTRVCTV
jgi:hypothetical protein